MMTKTIALSTQGAIISGATSFIGGILGGPFGLAIGATVGGIIALKISPGINFAMF